MICGFLQCWRSLTHTAFACNIELPLSCCVVCVCVKLSVTSVPLRTHLHSVMIAMWLQDPSEVPPLSSHPLAEYCDRLPMVCIHPKQLCVKTTMRSLCHKISCCSVVALLMCSLHVTLTQHAPYMRQDYFGCGLCSELNIPVWRFMFVPLTLLCNTDGYARHQRYGQQQS